MSDPHESLPPKLRQRLADLDGPSLFVPPEVDEAVLDTARGRLAEIRRKRRPPRRWGWWLGPVAAAAVVGLIVWATDPFGTAPGPRPLTARQEGAVTILDAFALARQRAAGDRSIRQSQIDRLAQEAVRLSRPALNGGAI